jgi:hypothetical protein
MSENHPPLFDLVTRQFDAWREERTEHQRAIDEIDRKVADAARTLGIDPAQIQAATPGRLPRRDGRTDGTMTEFMRECFDKADKGLTRMELKEMVRRDPRYTDKMKNENVYYNLIKRLIVRGEVVERDGALYAAHRAPLADGEDDESGEHLPGVISLFGPQKRPSDA